MQAFFYTHPRAAGDISAAPFNKRNSAGCNPSFASRLEHESGRQLQRGTIILGLSLSLANNDQATRQTGYAVDRAAKLNGWVARSRSRHRRITAIFGEAVV
jgi:hypothetical protein